MRSTNFRAVPAIAARLMALVVAMCIGSSASYAGGRPASFVVDGNTGAVISASNADEPRYPASLTKMMTLYIAFDLMQQGRLNEATRIRMSARAAAVQPTKLGIAADSDLALIDAIKSLITLSANDVAIAVAEHIAGSEEKFAALMTQKARAIGMKGTTFKNASGLPNSEQVTTARDMVTLGLRLQDDFPRYYALFAMRDFRYAGRNHANHNTMLNNFEGTEGIKTGYTSASGFNLVASVKRGSKHVVGAVFGGASASSRNQTMRTLLQMALFKASATKTRVPAAAVAVARVRPAPEPGIEARPTQYAAANTNLNPSTTAAAWPSASVEPAPSAVAPKMIEAVRVRPVLVSPRPPRQAKLPDAATSGSAAPAEFKLPPLAAATETMTPRQRPASMAEQPPMAMGLAGVPVLVRGSPPSSLQRQAATLSSDTAQVQRPVPLSAPPIVTAGAGVEIQIGAFGSAAEAERQLSVVRQKASDLLGSAHGKAQPTTANGKSLWRARFGGLQNAGTVCTELRRRQIDCLVAKAE